MVEVGDCCFIYFKILTALCNIKNQWKIRDDLINLKFAKEKKNPWVGSWGSSLIGKEYEVLVEVRMFS